MKISEIITELQARLEIYGDTDVVFRDSESDYGARIASVYFDEDADVCVMSDFVMPEGF